MEEKSFRGTEAGAVIVLCIISMLFVHVGGTLATGFFSDDHDFITLSGSSAGIAPLESHHRTLLLPFLFRLTAGGMIGASFWHGTSLALHLVNSMLVWFLLRRRLGSASLPSAAAALMVSALPTGMEALAWPGAIGYPAICTLVLLAVIVAMSCTGRTRIITLSLLQLAGWAVWDWAVLITPAVLVSEYIQRRWGRRIVVLDPFNKGNLPLFLCWLIPVAVALFSGHPVAYRHPAAPFHMLRIVLGTPLLVLGPSVKTGFLRSLPGILSVAALAGIVATGSVADRNVRLLVLLMLVFVLPSALFGIPQSRYMYIPALFLLAALSILADRIKPRFAAAVLLSALAAAQVIQAREYSLLWRKAWIEAENIRAMIDGLPIDEELLVVNLPDTWGAEDRLFRPWVWRNGMSAFDRVFRQAATPDCYWRRNAEGLPVVEREDIAESFSGDAVYEVVLERNGTEDSFGLERLR